MEETPVGAGPYFVDDIGLEIDVERTGHVLARGCLGEESAEAIVVRGRRVLDETTIGLKRLFRHNRRERRVVTHAETVLDGVEFPCETRSSANAPDKRVHQVRTPIDTSFSTHRCTEGMPCIKAADSQQALPICTPA